MNKSARTDIFVGESDENATRWAANTMGATESIF
jgi:hypothetical protein